MPSWTIETPSQLVACLVGLFPGFADIWDDGESYGYENGEYSYHCVLQIFAPVSNALLSQATDKQIREFCSLIDYMVEEGGILENAISTCFLEHASQVDAYKFIKPLLSPRAKAELR
jgi:hypothetical protein